MRLTDVPEIGSNGEEKEDKVLQPPPILPMNILLLGNPGKGKSTLLNGLMGEAKFKSGISYFQGNPSIHVLQA